MPVKFVGNVSVFQQQQFEEAMLYLNGATGITDILYALTTKEVNVKFVYNNQDFYDIPTNTILWDPNSSLSVIQPDGTVGAQSPALGLFHEMIHWLYAHDGTPDADESEATTYEQIAAISLGEAVRPFYTAHSKWTTFVTVNNPTAHTAGGYWVAIDVNGNPVQGPKHDPNQQIVSIKGGPTGSNGTATPGGSGGSGSGEHGGVGGVGSGTQVGGTDLGNPAGGGHTGGGYWYPVPQHSEAPGPYDGPIMPAEQAVVLVGEIQGYSV